MSASTILIFMTLMTMLTLVIQRTHLLMSLIALEGMILSLTIMLIFTTSSPAQISTFLFIILLTFGACEASLGLALLVSMARAHGTDMVNSLSINKC